LVHHLNPMLIKSFLKKILDLSIELNKFFFFLSFSFYNLKFWLFFNFFFKKKIIVSRADGGFIMQEDIVSRLFDIESAVWELRSPNDDTLDAFCFKPLGDFCVVQSITGYCFFFNSSSFFLWKFLIFFFSSYWQGNKTFFENDPQGWYDHLIVPFYSSLFLKKTIWKFLYIIYIFQCLFNSNV